MNLPEVRPQDRLLDALQPYRHLWPTEPFSPAAGWRTDDSGRYRCRELPEHDEELARDSRWPALFPSPICLLTTTDGRRVALEREVGASIVNRFPYVVAVSLCREPLSPRHHARRTFMDILERRGVASLQFLPPGRTLDAALDAVSSIPDARSTERIRLSGLATRPGETNPAPVLQAAYLVYEASFARPQTDFEGRPIYACPWVDVGSHRIYFLEIHAIQLRHDIASGDERIRWRALPVWRRAASDEGPPVARAPAFARVYEKGYEPNYVFPANSTVAFEFDQLRHGMAIKHLPPLPADQVEVDNDRARWPCFFPSSCALITTWSADGTPNVMPCGSTTVVSRQPLVIAPCVSYARINVRYAARRTLGLIRERGRFGCSVPYLDQRVVDGLKYAGNISLQDDPGKVLHSGLRVGPSAYGPVVEEAPIHFDCEVTGEIRLGTHVMFLGEARGVKVRSDLSPGSPLEWCPWPGLTARADGTAQAAAGTRAMAASATP